MLIPNFHGSFKRERKLMKKRNKDMNKLAEIMTMLINEQPLLPKHENHRLHGDYEGWWECHVGPDWVLIYRSDKEKRTVTFSRTGSHSDLF
ncbi:MAG: type II toxin-antitoxin system YafQ family toxin [Treponema sp.]|jgi:mRNA interferase YafQ|nr:type II toxin-antitoxin system YafQ family toxin [Treponema sp.]